MPIQPCPACGNRTPRLLDFTSRYAHVNFQRCECGHIWTTDQQDGYIVRNVTPLAERAPA